MEAPRTRRTRRTRRVEAGGRRPEATYHLGAVIRKSAALVTLVALASLAAHCESPARLPAAAAGQGRVARIRQRGALVCGVAPGVAGFAHVDEQGRYSGFDVDICRALSAAIFGNPDKVRYEQASSVEQFLRVPEVDVVSRRLTWSLQREGMGLLFGPVMFYDGQGFLVPTRLRIQAVRQLSNLGICVVAGGSSESTLTRYFQSHELTLRKVLIRSTAQLGGVFLDGEFSAGRCGAFTADLSELGSLRSGMGRPEDFGFLDEQISKEPLAQVVRQ